MVSSKSHEASKDSILVALAAGTHSWLPTPENEAFQDDMLEIMREHAITRLDTARSYGMGASEVALGNKGLADQFVITTKAPTGLGNGAGKSENILRAANESFEALKVGKVPVYLMHGPDDSVPIADTYSAIQTLYEQGRFEKFGLSNFNKDQVLEYYNYAKSNNLVLPTVFQSTYSPALRLNETCLFPTLRSLNMSIQAYSPLAMGFLSKTPSDIEHSTGRWDPSTPSGRMHRIMFYKPSYMRMLEEWGKLAMESGVGRVGLAYRWVRYHSFLKGALGDEMIIGASSAEQFKQTMDEIEKGPLEDWVLKRVDELWEVVRNDAEIDNLKAFKEVFGN